MRIRFFTLAAVLSFVFFTLAYKLYGLQIIHQEFFAAKAESQFQSDGYLEPRRGVIYFTDKNGNNIHAVLNKKYAIVYAVPVEIKEPRAAAQILSGILNRDEEELARRFSKFGDEYELLAEKIGSDTAARIREAAPKGIYIDSREFRYYPLANLAAHTLGFVGRSSNDEDNKGRYGLELQYDDFLRGKPGRMLGDRVLEPTHGGDLMLTLDRNIQAEAERIMLELIRRHGAEGGTVIVEEPKTGKLLALGNYPAFNPNQYSESGISRFLNPAIQSVYEPGSVFKVFTMAAGIDSGKISTTTAFTDTGSLTLNGKTIQNWDHKAYGKVTMNEVIARSINTGAAFAAREIGRETFADYLAAFGFGERTGIGLPGEVLGNLKNVGHGARDIDIATASYGQGVSVTPLNLLGAISAIANGGALMRPFLTTLDQPEAIRRVIRPETAREVARMMVGAVEKAGVAAIPHYTVAGKTGTALVPDFNQGGYTNDYIHSYAGFAPASNPQFAILIKLDRPKGTQLAGLTVVPAFKELAQFIINYYGIPPDNLDAQMQQQF